MEIIARSESHYFRWQPYVLLEAIRFSEKRSFLVKTIPFSGGHYFLWKPVEIIHLVETVPFNGRQFLYWKLFLLLQAIHFRGNHSF